MLRQRGSRCGDNGPLLFTHQSSDGRGCSYYPQSRKRGKRSTVATQIQKIFIAVGLILLAVPWYKYVSAKWKLGKMRNMVADAKHDKKRLTKQLETVAEELKQVKDESKALIESNAAMIKVLKKYGDNILDMDNSAYAEEEKLEENMITRIDELHTAIRQTSKRRLLKKYGSNVDSFRIQVNLKENQSLIIETAPIRLVPHAVDHFLTLVENKAYDGLKLIHQAVGASIIKSSLIDSETGQVDNNRFDELVSPIDMAFSDRSSDYKMEKYSVAFVSKGPHFFINVADPTSPTEATSEAATCFGRVVEGHAILDKLTSNHHEEGSAAVLGVESIRMLSVERT